MDSCKKYLECFLAGSSTQMVLERFDRHNAMLVDIQQNYPEFKGFSLKTLKRVSKDITDNLDVTIGLPLDGIFDPDEYAGKLKVALLKCLRNNGSHQSN